MKKIRLGKILLVLIIITAMLVLGACSSKSTTKPSPTTTPLKTTATVPTTTPPKTTTPAPTTIPPTTTPASTTTPPPTTTGVSVTVNLIAKNLAFDKSSITVPAGATVTLNFDNQDAGIPHNFALYTDSSANPPALFQGQIIQGAAKITYTFTAPSTPGTYFFRCDVHPSMMTGSFIVQ
jgi:plastocyanin